MLEILFEETQLKFRPEKCLANRYSGYNCNKCISACPFQAIQVNGKLEVKRADCQNCGLCVSVCPVEAFSFASVAQLTNQVPKGGQVTLACQKSQMLDCFKFPCLGFLKEEMLLGLVLTCDRVMVIWDLARCRDCQAQAGQTIKDRLAKVSELAAALKKTAVLKIESEGIQQVSRREFFAFLKKQTKSTAVRVSVLPERGISQLRLGRYISPSRRLFLEAVQGTVTETTEIRMPGQDWSFGNFRVTSQCNGCGECTLFCVSGALQMDKQQNEIRLTHETARCLNCGLCIAKCKKRAIVQEDSLDLNQVLSSKNVLLKTFTAVSCTLCGRPVNSPDEISPSTLCDKCQNEFKHRLRSKETSLIKYEEV